MKGFEMINHMTSARLAAFLAVSLSFGALTACADAPPPVTTTTRSVTTDTTAPAVMPTQQTTTVQRQMTTTNP